MDLIDMRNRPDHVDSGKIFKWIIQLKDHFTKYCWAQPLETKEAKESGMHIVHERPRHPQSQGLIERANAILTDALGK
ncbi:unnamed protein product [Rotaria sp. Silwood1]|nr:unnamed protein product [Rotaria sp. Silwood1]